MRYRRAATVVAAGLRPLWFRAVVPRAKRPSSWPAWEGSRTVAGSGYMLGIVQIRVYTQSITDTTRSGVSG